MKNISRRDFGKTLGLLGLTEALPHIGSAPLSAAVGPGRVSQAEIDVVRARRETPGAERVLHF